MMKIDKKFLDTHKIDGVLVSSLPSITYLIGDFGFSENERECFLLILKNKKYLITDKRYSQVLKKDLKDYIILDEGVVLFLRKSAKDLFKKNKIFTIGIEENNINVAEYKLLKKYTKASPIDLSNIRMIKSDDEIKNIQLACNIGDNAFKFIIKHLVTGITEKDISTKLDIYIKQKNAETSFNSIVAFGKNSSIPHHLSNKTKLKKNQIVLLDFGVKINNYCSDMTRTVFFGKADDKFKKIHKTVLKSQKLAISRLGNGTKLKNIDKIARDYIEEQGYPSIPHSLGHGIGLEVHESPRLSPYSKDKLENGMVFSVEPGIYIESWGGVRIEDLVVIKNNKPQLITRSPRKLIEL